MKEETQKKGSETYVCDEVWHLIPKLAAVPPIIRSLIDHYELDIMNPRPRSEADEKRRNKEILNILTLVADTIEDTTASIEDIVTE